MKRFVTHCLKPTIGRMYRSALLLGVLALSACGNAKEPRQIDVHDPVMAKEGDTYYLFSTGPGITIYSSKDKLQWHNVGRVFATEPSWAKTVVPDFGGHLWAPDIVQNNGLYHLYYSVSAFGKNTSAIGVAVNKTLDNNSPDYEWIDKGIVIQSVPERDNWNAIDAGVIADKEGNGWFSFGSFWGGLKIFKLNEDWTAPAEPQVWYTIATRGNKDYITEKTDAPTTTDIEAPFIFKKDNYYYLFASWGFCCKKGDSTYHLVVGRSTSVTGPYLDKDGIDMAKGGGTLVIKGNERWKGLGHNSAYTFDGKDYLVLHAYESADDYLQKLKILDMTWQEGWPVVDEAQLDSFKAYVVK